MPQWFVELLGLTAAPREGERVQVNGQDLVFCDGVLRNPSTYSQSQAQTEKTFGYKWNKRETFESGIPAQMRGWLLEKYGNVCTRDWFQALPAAPVVLDAGCGAALSALALLDRKSTRLNSSH